MGKKKRITEEDGEQNKWCEEARTMTLEKFPAFVTKLASDFEHDYGTICHATTAAAIAAAWAVAQAAERLKGIEKPAGAVEEHWQSIVEGKVPFGYRVGED